MKFQFTQGVLSCDLENGKPFYLKNVNSTVSLEIRSTPLRLLLADSTTNYLIEVPKSPNQIKIPNGNVYIFLLVDWKGDYKLDYQVTPPTSGVVEPKTPKDGDYWFDVLNLQLKKYNQGWQKCVGIYLGMVNSSVTVYPNIGISQVGLVDSYSAGYIVYGDGVAKTSNGGVFVTSDVKNTILNIQEVGGFSALEDIKELQVVYFEKTGMCRGSSSNHNLINKKPIGISLTDVKIGQVGTYKNFGVLTHKNFKFTEDQINKSIWLGVDGGLSVLKPTGLVCNIGKIKSTNSIELDIKLEMVEETTQLKFDISAVYPLVIENQYDGTVTNKKITLEKATKTNDGFMSFEHVNIITDLKEQTNSLQNTISRMDEVFNIHTHSMTDIKNFALVLSDYSKFDHSHSEFDVFKKKLSEVALINHTHSISKINDLQNQLDKRVLKTGGEVGGMFFNGDVISPNQLVNKQYVDLKTENILCISTVLICPFGILINKVKTTEGVEVFLNDEKIEKINGITLQEDDILRVEGGFLTITYFKL